jgi:hypothetical protein
VKTVKAVIRTFLPFELSLARAFATIVLIFGKRIKWMDHCFHCFHCRKRSLRLSFFEPVDAGFAQKYQLREASDE